MFISTSEIGLLDFVLFVYDLIKLIIEVSIRLRTNSYLIPIYNTQVQCLMNAYFICVILRIQM